MLKYKIYTQLKQISKKTLTLSKNLCKTELRRFSDLASTPDRNQVPPKSIHDMYKQSLLNCVPYLLTCQHALRSSVFTWQRVLRTYVLTWQCALRAYVLTYQRALRAYMLTSLRVLHAPVLTC